MNKNLIFIFIVVLSILIFYSTTNEKNPSTNTQQQTVVIATFVSHPALDSMISNIKEKLVERGYTDGGNIKIIQRNANGQMSSLQTIASDIQSIQPDLTIAVTTPVAQVLANRRTGKFIFAAVTDPVGAGIITSLDQPEKDISGVTDSWPYEKQLTLIKEISPEVKKLAVLFNPADTASQYGMKQVRLYAKKLGFELIEGPVSGPGDVFSVANNVLGKADAVWLSSDAVAISGVSAAARVAISEQKPLFVGDSGTVAKGGLAAASIGYDTLGLQAGALAADFLDGSNMLKVVTPDGSAKVIVNLKAAELMGVTIPKSVLENAIKYTDIIE